MSVVLYTGSPGSGKSYHAAKEIIFNLKHGRNVMTNFPLYVSDYSKKLSQNCKLPVYVDNDSLTVDYLVNYSKSHHKKRKEGQTLLIIDECSAIFNSRDFNAADRKQWLIFFAQHRKYGYNIILICQFDKQIDKQIRGCVQFEYYHLELKVFNTFGYFLSLLLRKVFVIHKYIYSPFGNVHSKGNRCGFSFVKFNPRISKLYNTFEIFDKKIDNTPGNIIDVEVQKVPLPETETEVKAIADDQPYIYESNSQKDISNLVNLSNLL